MMNKNAKISMICGIASLVVSLFLSVIIGPIIAVVAIVFSVLAKKELKKLKDGGKGKGKSQATAGLTCAIISLVIVAITALGMLMINNIEIASAAYCPKEMGLVKDCVDNGDGTSTCMYMDQIEMNCYTEVLDESQFK